MLVEPAPLMTVDTRDVYHLSASLCETMTLASGYASMSSGMKAAVGTSQQAWVVGKED